MLRGGRGNARWVSDKYGPEGLGDLGTWRQLCQQLPLRVFDLRVKQNRSQAPADPPGEQCIVSLPHIALTSENAGPLCRLATQKSGSGVGRSLLTQLSLFPLGPGFGNRTWERLRGNGGSILIWGRESLDWSRLLCVK